MKKCRIAITLIFLSAQTVFAQPKTESLLNHLLLNNQDSIVREVVQHANAYRCQIIYTQINRDKRNRPHCTNYYFNYDPQLYFNPASTVKMPLAFLSLEKINGLKKWGIDKYTPLQIDSSFDGQKTAYHDSTSANKLPSIAHYIKKAFLVSDNDAYNRMYQFLGQQTINRNLHNKGYQDARITRQFMGFSEEQNRHTNAIRFLNDNGLAVYTQPAAYNTDSFDYSHVVKIGNGHFDNKDSLINEPFDFTRQNNLSLSDLQQMLQSVIFPETVPKKQRFKLTQADRNFLLQYLSQFPGETNYPKYDSVDYYNSYVKFFFSNSTHRLPAGIRVFNKVGWAYGFMTDVSYVADFNNNVEFMLAATVYVNSDGILNDNRYDYDTKGHPFFYELGQTIYQYELNRKTLHKPNLSGLIMPYEERQPDGRQTIKVVEN